MNIFRAKTEEIQHAIQKMKLIDDEDALISYNYSNSGPREGTIANSLEFTSTLEVVSIIVNSG